jgi:hypothetical protein
MPDLDQIKQGEQGMRDRRGRFTKGRSGSPASQPRGRRDHVNRAAGLFLAATTTVISPQASSTGSPSPGLQTRRAEFL